MIWLLVIIISYLFFSLAYFGDKLVVSGPSNPKLYTFYVGVLSILIVVFIPFAKFSFLDGWQVLWITLEAVTYILGLYTMFLALEKFDVSRVMTTIGAVQPIIILLLTWMFWGSVITGKSLFAFVLLLLGGFIISIEKKKKGSGNYLPLVLCSAVMFSLEYVFSKLIFLHMPFLTALIWMRIFSFVIVLVFLVDPKLRDKVFAKKQVLNKKTGLLFLVTQSAGAIAGVLQSFAIALVPVSYLAIVNSLRGIQYVFLFLITASVSFLFPRVLKENISKKVIIQKIIAITCIVIGLALLV